MHSRWLKVGALKKCAQKRLREQECLAGGRQKKMMQEGKEEGRHGKAVDRWAHLLGPEHCPGCGLEPFVCGCIDMGFTGEQKKERRGNRTRERETETKRQQDESESGTERTTGNLGDEIGTRISGWDTEEYGG